MACVPGLHVWVAQTASAQLPYVGHMETAVWLWVGDFHSWQRSCTKSAKMLFYSTGEFGSVMEGNLDLQDGTSQKVAVKTMKCELPLMKPFPLGVGSCLRICVPCSW